MTSRYPKLQKALLYAAEKHYGQDRDGSDPPPYLTHPVDVVVRLRYVGGVTDEDVLIAGALHDVIEECGVKPGAVTRRFGLKVGRLVQEMTREEPDPASLKSLGKDEIWQIRSDLLLQGIRSSMSPDAWTIKLADRLSNLSEALHTRVGRKRERYIGQSRVILDIIPRKTNPGLWDAIDTLIRAENG